MRPNRSLLAVALVMVAGVASLAMAPPASAAKARRPSPAPAPSPPPNGWVVDRVRIEPVDPADEIDVAGGAYLGAIEIGRPAPATIPAFPLQPAQAPATKSRGRATTTTTTKPTTTTVLKASTAGPLSVVNDVGLDDYVSGISEVPSSWPAEALKAQAIAARTYALHQLSVGRTLCDTDACQVYTGLAKQRAAGGASWVDAVQATSGEVLLYRGQPILAMYSSSDGGQTQAGSMPYLKSVDDPDDGVAPLSRWAVTMPFDLLTTLFATPKPVLDAHRTAHDTVELIWNNDDGTTGTLDVPTAAFGAKLNSQPAPAGLPRMMPSLRFGLVVDQQAGTVTIDGGGYGHGVGMSQYGAMGKASRGMAAADILADYYDGLRPVKLAANRLPATIRVTLQSGLSGPVTVSSPGRFVVRASDGRVLANLASGTWQVASSGNAVRVVAPAGQDAAPAPTVTTLDTPANAPAIVRFHTNVPGIVGVTVQPPGGAPASVAPAPMDAGDHSVTVPGAVRPTGNGRWQVTLTLDAGTGRAVAVPIAFQFGPPPAHFENVVPLPLGTPIAAVRPAVVFGSPARGQGTHLAMGMTAVAILTLLGAVVAFVWPSGQLREPEPARLL